MKFQIVGFALVAVLVVAGVDYSMQSRKSGKALGEIGLSGYVDTITGRYHASAEASALAKRQKQAAKVHLPEAPEGWTRREWEDGDNARLEPPEQEMSGWEYKSVIARELSPLMAGMIAGDIKGAPRLRRKEIWVYERGDEIIALRAVFTKPDAKTTFSSLVKRVETANIRGVALAQGYAMFDGVAFGEIPYVDKGDAPAAYRRFSASIGGDVAVSVRAVAQDASIKALLSAVDYNGLNAMLDQPMESIGATADPSITADQVFEARRAVLRAAGLIPKAVEAEVAVAAEAEAKEPAPKRIEVGFASTAGMPGQKCVRIGGSRICATPTE